MTALILFLIVLLMAYAKWDCLPINRHPEPHVDIRFDAECVSLGVIPENLAWTIPKDYADREGWSMASRIEPTFVGAAQVPKWALVLTLTNPTETRVVTVIYNDDGSLHEH